MHQSNLSISELQDLDDLDNVNLSFSAQTPLKPGNIPSLDMSQVYDEDMQQEIEEIQSSQKSIITYLPGRYQYRNTEQSSSEKLIQLKKQRFAKIEFKVKERIEKDKNIRKERCASFNKIGLARTFNIEKLGDSLSNEKFTRFEEDIFEVKIRNRVKESWKILKKGKLMKMAISKSIIHATLGENIRIVEAHLDVCGNDLERLKKVNVTDQCLRSSLHYAAALGNEDLVVLLLQMGADPKVRDYKNRSPLHYVPFSNSHKIIEILLRGYKNHSKIVKSMSTIKNFHTVARVLKYKRPIINTQSTKFKFLNTIDLVSINIDPKLFNENIEELLEKMNISSGKAQCNELNGKFIDWVDNEGRTSLHLAVMNEKPTIVQALLEAGSKITIEDVYNKRPLELSTSKYITTLLVYKLKENMNKTKDKSGHGTIDNRDLLVLSEADISKYIKNDSQSTYLMNSVKSCNIETVKILLNKKVSISASNIQGWNALMYAVQANNLVLVKIMLEGSEHEYNRWKFGIKSWVEDAWKALDSLTKEGWNIIHIAAIHSSAEMLEYLLEVFKMRKVVQMDNECPEVFKNLEVCSLDKFIDQPCRKKLTPYLQAVRHNRLDIIKILVTWGCDTYSRNSKLQNALHISAGKGFAEVLEYLVRQDSDKNILRSQLDIQKRRPKDLDVFNKLDSLFLHIWDYCRLGEVEKIQELISSKKYTINEQTPLKKNTPLHLAIEFKQIKSMRLLISLGADIKICNHVGKSSLDNIYSSLDQDFIKSALKILAPSLKPLDKKNNVESELFQNQKKSEKNLTQNLPKINKINKLEKSDFFKYWEIINKKLVEKKVSIAFIFDMMGQSHKGCLNMSEFKSMLVWLGLTFSSEICSQLFKNADENMNDLLEYHETVRQIHRVSSKFKLWPNLKSATKMKLNKTLC